MEKASISVTERSNTSMLYNHTIERFKSFQNEDGSFGNTHTTAWITQVSIIQMPRLDEIILLLLFKGVQSLLSKSYYLIRLLYYQAAKLSLYYYKIF